MLLCKLLGLLSLHSAQVPEIALVSDKHDHHGSFGICVYMDTIERMLGVVIPTRHFRSLVLDATISQFLQPLLSTGKCTGLGNVVHKESAQCTAIVTVAKKQEGGREKTTEACQQRGASHGEPHDDVQKENAG